MHDVWALTDIHGNYQLYKTAKDFIKQQDDESIIIFLGDAIDRGSDGYKIMKELLDNPYVIYLMGNHESMFVQAASFIKKDYRGELDEESIHRYLYSLMMHDFFATQVTDSLYNGGSSTLIAWMLDDMPEDIISRVRKLPLTFSYEGLDFCHSGSNYNCFKRAAEEEYNGELVDADDKESLIWDRDYIGQGWAEGRICIHGHTPTNYLPPEYYNGPTSSNEAIPYVYQSKFNEEFPGLKFDLDVGTYNNGKLYIFNCLTYECFGFQDLDANNEEIETHNIIALDKFYPFKNLNLS